jgi:Fe-S cluster biogenesis protein NfuA
MVTIPPNFSDQERIEALIEQLDSYISHYHGGGVELISFDGQTAKVRLGGACLGCPLSPVTLHGWVEGTIHQFFPGVKVEQAV